MTNNYNTTMTDYLERQLLRQELDYYNDAPLRSLFRWIGVLIKNAQNKLVSFVAAVSSELDSARKEGHKVTAL